MPLIPPEESLPRWREYEQRVASLTRVVQRAGLPVPTAVLKSIDDLDGDFELQAPAAGGSKGVLVPPWVYDGPIAVTTDAQSPFRNRHPGGRVGASIPAGSQPWHLGLAPQPAGLRQIGADAAGEGMGGIHHPGWALDRKSTRLNSSHSSVSRMPSSA